MPAAAIPNKTVKLSWILSALALMIVIAGGCAYLSLCLLFYQGQWQLLFHPSASVSLTPAGAGIPFEAIRFDTSETGAPRLSGWWMPGAEDTGKTILYLHGGSGSLSNTLPALARLHALGFNIFAIDYQGYGQSLPLHPSEQSMLADTDAAFSYLVDLRHLAPGSIVLYGEGTGATIAAEAVPHHPQMKRVILENLNAPAIEILKADPRTSLLPVKLLMTSPLNPAGALRTAGAARLFVGKDANTFAAFQRAAGPKSRADAPDPAILRTFVEAP